MGGSFNKIGELSHRQKEILRLTSKHLQAKEIARLLKISEHTVKTHKDQARKRLGVSTSREAAMMLASYEAEITLPLGGGDQSRGIVSPPNLASFSLSADATAFDAKEDEDAPKLSESRSPPDDLIERSSNSMGYVSEPGQSVRNPKYNLSGRNPDWDGGPIEGSVYRDSRHSLANQRWSSLSERLASLTPIQCVGLVIVIAGTLVVFTAGLIACILAIMTAAQHLKSQSG